MWVHASVVGLGILVKRRANMKVRTGSLVMVRSHRTHLGMMSFAHAGLVMVLVLGRRAPCVQLPVLTTGDSNCGAAFQPGEAVYFPDGAGGGSTGSM